MRSNYLLSLQLIPRSLKDMFKTKFKYHNSQKAITLKIRKQQKRFLFTAHALIKINRRIKFEVDTSHSFFRYALDRNLTAGL